MRGSRATSPSFIGPFRPRLGRRPGTARYFSSISEENYWRLQQRTCLGNIWLQNKSQRACRVENLEFEPERRVVGQGSNIDIATFNFSYDELRAIRKQGLVADSASWPPPHPFSGQGALFAGFPRASRLWIDRRSISFGLYSAFLRIDSSYDLQITCPFERDCWIDATERGLPPRGFDLGGISGGPLITPMDTDGVWNLHLAGVVSEAKTSKDYETVVSVPAHFIACDGTIYDERSAPIRHAVAA
jgi:hypothetical protein